MLLAEAQPFGRSGWKDRSTEFAAGELIQDIVTRSMRPL
jgi:hypothetical protein